MEIRIKSLLKVAWIPIALCWLGALLNILVIRANGGMPASSLDTAYGKWVPLTRNTQLSFLGDVIPILNAQCSLGDILMYLGTAFWVYFAVRNLYLGYKIQRKGRFQRENIAR
jgi:hypothetical protein